MVIKITAKSVLKSMSALLLITSVFVIAGCASRSDYEKGYDAGAGDIVKEQYWITQNRQKETQKSDYKVRYYKFDAPTNVDGVKYVPHKITVRSVEL